MEVRDEDMSKLFDAAKTGNLQRLKELKDEGLSFNQKDDDGNTPLLWAAYYGHRKAVKWLLLNTGANAQVTDANNAGNTALLLAVAGNHLSLVRWLLKEGGATHTEQNNFGNTALTSAVNNGQMLIVDHLIRHYYLSPDFKLECSSRSKVITYYFKLIELFSQKEVNYPEIHSLLDIASPQLNDNDLKCLHFIYLWMDIARLDSSVRAFAKDIDFDHLLPSHQFELVSHMFECGYVLNNQSINQNDVIRFNDAQKEIIKEILKQGKHDNYLISIDSDDEKDELFNTYYLMPLYRNVIHAHQTKDNIDKALTAPYFYHYHASKSSLLQTDVAKWTAYHLCQAAGTSKQQHYDAYEQTTGLSRQGYYEVIEKYLSDSHPHKNSLLLIMGNLPDSNGERLYWVKNHPSWIQKLGHELGGHASSQDTSRLRLIGIEHPISLNEDVIQQVWDRAQHKPMPQLLPGNHPVYQLKKQGVYCKIYPGLPGIHDALQYLYRRLFGVRGGVPWSVTGLLEIDNHTIPVLFSRDAGKRVHKNDSRLKKLNLYRLSKLILFNILTNPEDGKADNFTLEKYTDGTYSVCNVDYEQAWVEATVKSSQNGKPKLAIKSLLFCLDEMKKPLDKDAIKEFLAINIIETMKAWLGDLVKLDHEYKVLFDSCKDLFAEEKEPQRRCFLHMIAPLPIVIQIALRLQQLQSRLKEDVGVSPLSLLAQFEPTAANYYRRVLNNNTLSSATMRFDALVKDEMLYGRDEKTGRYSTTLTLSNELFKLLVPDNFVDVVAPHVALHEFIKIIQKWERLDTELVRLLKGDIEHFKTLSTENQQALLKLSKLNQLNTSKRGLLLDSLVYRKDLTDVHWHYLQDTLREWHLSYLIHYSKNLNKLSIKKATALTALKALEVAENLTYLTLAQLPLITEFTAKLLHVRELVLKDMAELKILDLNAPTLQRLRVADCSNLEAISLPESVLLDNVLIQRCKTLPLADFYIQWPRFIHRWHGIPAKLREGLASFIMQTFPELTMVPQDKVYSIVANYLKERQNLYEPLLLRLNTKHRREKACLLAHAGYDTPEVTSILLKGLHNALNDSYQNFSEFLLALSVLEIANEQLIATLLKGLKSPKESIQLESIRTLAGLKIKDESVSLSLLSAMNDKNWRIRHEATKSLSALSLNREKIVPELLNALKDESWFVRVEAAEIVCSKGVSEEPVIRGLIAMLGASCIEEIHLDNFGYSIYHRFEYGQKVVLPKIKTELVTPILITMLQDCSDTMIQKIAIRAAGTLCIKDETIVSELVKALGDASQEINVEAALALSEIGVKCTESTKILCDILNDSTVFPNGGKYGQYFRVLAIRSLGSLKLNNKEIYQAFLNISDRHYTSPQLDCYSCLILQAIINALDDQTCHEQQFNILQSLSDIAISEKAAQLTIKSNTSLHGEYRSNRYWKNYSNAKAFSEFFHDVKAPYLEMHDEFRDKKNIFIIMQLGIIENRSNRHDYNAMAGAIQILVALKYNHEKFVYALLACLSTLDSKFNSLNRNEQCSTSPVIEEIIGAIEAFKINNDELIKLLLKILSAGQQKAFHSIFKKAIQVLVALENKNKQVINFLSKTAVVNDDPEIRIKSAQSLVKFLQFEKIIQPKFDELIRLQGKENDPGMPAFFPGDTTPSEEMEIVEAPITPDAATPKPIENKPLFVAIDEGDLESLKQLLKKHNNAVFEKNQSGNTLLSFAASSKHLLIVDHLIRHYYVNAIFDENEKKALNHFTENIVVQFYFSAFTLFSKSSVNYNEIESLLAEASSQLQKEDLSYIYLVYLWMRVKHLANKLPGTVRTVAGEPHMSQLSIAHQAELISHMIREGYALNNWSINSDTLTISDMKLDEKQVNAIQKLLEQSIYDICLKTHDSVIECNKIYFEMSKNKTLKFTVKDLFGEIKSGLISELNDAISLPLTLEQLKSMPSILKVISGQGHTRSGIQKLILNGVRFTKEYHFLLNGVVEYYERNILYVQLKEDGVEYIVITPYGKKIIALISHEEFKERTNGFVLPNTEMLLIQSLKQRISNVLQITCERGHTFAENETKGYKTFLAFLNNPFLMPNLQELQLQDCDLYDLFDLPSLYPILVEMTALTKLNLDGNHITRQGVLTLLGAFRSKTNNHPMLEDLSVSFNEIEVNNAINLMDFARKRSLIKTIDFTGNMIAIDALSVKNNHKTRMAALSALFLTLSKKEPGFTVNSFLTATDIKLTKLNDDADGSLQITLADSRLITASISHKDIGLFSDVGLIKNEHDGSENRTPKELFLSLIKGITPIRIPKELRDSLLSPTPFNVHETDKICKKLLNYHENAKLNGQLIRHSFFRSEKMEIQPSYLFPEEPLTLKKGWVYLIANKYNGIFGNEHAMLGYEYLTSSGQRVFKVAHLQHDPDPDLDKTYIVFISMPLSQLIPWTKLGRIIAKIPADTKCLRNLDDNVMEDVLKGKLFDVTFKKIIYGSSLEKKFINCLRYCLIKIAENLKIEIIHRNQDCRPSTVVRNYIENNPVIENGKHEISIENFL